MRIHDVQNLAAMYFSSHGHIGSDDIGMIVFIVVLFMCAFVTLLMDALEVR